jgi:hypothetical protein
MIFVKLSFWSFIFRSLISRTYGSDNLQEFMENLEYIKKKYKSYEILVKADEEELVLLSRTTKIRLNTIGHVSSKQWVTDGVPIKQFKLIEIKENDKS